MRPFNWKSIFPCTLIKRTNNFLDVIVRSLSEYDLVLNVHVQNENALSVYSCFQLKK